MALVGVALQPVPTDAFIRGAHVDPTDEAGRAGIDAMETAARGGQAAIVVRDDLAVWQKLNVTAFLTTGIVGPPRACSGSRTRTRPATPTTGSPSSR